MSYITVINNGVTDVVTVPQPAPAHVTATGITERVGSGPSTHNHDDRYYTETEAGNLFAPIAAGIPTGGTTGQIIKKVNGTDYNIAWGDDLGAVAHGWGNHASAGYLTGITGLQVTNALGFTPYNASNPDNYITAAALIGYATESYVTSQGYLVATNTDKTNWNTAYSQTRQWDGGSTGLNAATARTSLGLVIGTDVLAYRTFGSAANNNTGDFQAAGNYVTAASGKTGLFSNTLTLAGTDGSTLNIGTGGTLGTAAYTASADYALLAGRSGGQTLIGGTGVTDVLSLIGTSGNGTAGSAAIQLKVGNNGATTAVTVLNNGNFGIGVASPGEKLTVLGGASFTSHIKMANNTYLTNSTSAATMHIGGGETDTLNLIDGKVQFIRSSGNVGIGYTGPAARLSINGSLLVNTNTSAGFTADINGTGRFSGRLTLAASTTSASTLNIPSGTAPTSPVNGDIWSDGSDLKVRLGGVTYTIQKV